MQIAAFFDMDKTLVRCNTGSRWIRFLRERQEIDTVTLLRSLYWTVQYRLSILDMESVAGRLAADMAGESEQALRDKAEIFLSRDVLPEIAPAARERIEHHRQERHVLAILSSSTPYITEPLARHLGLDHVLCTRLDTRDGRFVGTLQRPACYGPGKVYHAERFARVHDIDLQQSFFYTDSYSDLPMLLRVGQRCIVNPDARLLRYARRQGWEIERW